MSGHSKWATIKHQKGVSDQRRGQLFTKLGRAISIAVREGGGIDPDTNFKLRLTVEKARRANMPKDNIQRAIERGTNQGGGSGLEEIVYEGYGPGNVAILIEVVTDNKNRSLSSIKKVFDKEGGRLGRAGSVAFQFEKKGSILVDKNEDSESQMLSLIDLGVEDVEIEGDGVEIVVSAKELFDVKKKIEQADFKVRRAELIFSPQNLISLEAKTKGKILTLLEKLDDLDDVLNVYCNADL